MALIALGITGGIGAYKAVEVARGLQKRGHDVTAIMTRSARKFVGELTFEAITGRRVITSQFARGANADIEHIALASNANLLLVAPATANIIGKFANGIADDFLSSLYLATSAPVLLAPAMNTNMLAHEAVQQNLARLHARGAAFVEPGEGYLACGWIGKGRLAEPEAIVDAADQLLRGRRALAGRRIVVTAGPTLEDLDPVRFVGNRSTGRMGYAIAAEAARRGADVVLVTGPTAIEPPPVRELVRVRSAAEMHRAVRAHVQGAATQTRELHHRLLGTLGAREHGRGFGKQQAARLGEHNAPPDAIEQSRREMRLEMGDGRARGRLCQIERFRAARDMLLACDSYEHAQLFERQAHVTHTA